MSISACPRCAQHVTLPVGVDDHVQVRCPLCRAQYTLADALANVPPMLEVIAESVSVSDDWHQTSHEPSFEQQETARRDAAPMASLESPSQSEPLVAPFHGDEAEQPVEFESAPIVAGHDDITGHDDILTQEQDTELEEAEFTPFEPQIQAAAAEAELLGEADSSPGEGTLDFGEPEPLAAAEDVPAATTDEFELDFGEPLPAQQQADEEAPIDFGEPVDSGQKDVGESTIDFGQPLEAAEEGQPGVLDFEQPAELNAIEDDEEILPDFGEPPTEQPLAAKAESTAAPAGDKTKTKGGKKKAAKAKAPAPAAGKRSSLATLVNIAVPSLIAVPLALYIAVWIHPAYDFFNLGPKLPRWMVPAAVHKPIAKAPTGTQPTISPEALIGALAARREATAGGVGEPPATPAADEPTQQQPPTDADEPAGTDEAPPLPDAKGDAAGDATPKPDNSPLANDAGAPSEPAPADEAGNAPPETDVAETQDRSPAGPTLSSKPSADEAAATDDRMDDKGDDAAADNSNSLDDLVGDSKPPDEAAEELGPLDAPIFTAAELAKAIRDAVLANQKMMAAQNANQEAALKTARKEFYLGLYALANTATFAKDNAAQDQLDATRKNMEQLARALAADPKRLDAIKGNATRWLAFPNRSTPGIVLAGEVQDAQRVGKLYRVTIGPGGSPAGSVTVLCDKDPHVEPGDEVLTIGSIIDHPSVQLPAYDGTDAAVVWNGLTLQIRSEGK